MPTRPTIRFLLDLLRLAMRREATALYVVPWMPPTLRIGDRTVPLSSVAFTPEQTTRLVLDLLDDERRAALDGSREIEFGFTLDGVGRFRVHAFRRHGQPAMAIRPFAVDVPTPRALALPVQATQAVMAARGLLVVASTAPALRHDAAAALLEHRNRIGEGEIALLDGATRCWHEDARCRVQQGLDAAALQGLLQRRAQASVAPPPLAIGWGELRDGLQLERAVCAAEQALCVVTLPAPHLPGALQRLASLAAEHTGHALLHRTAIHLHAVLSLRAVPASEGGRDLALTQALMNSAELAANLAEGDLDALRALLAPVPPAPAAKRPGLTLPTGPDEHLAQLLVQGLVTHDVAMRHAADPAALARVREALAPPAVDSGFADLFDAAAPAADPFAFDAPDRAPPHPADTQFDDVDWSAGATPSRPLALDPRPLGGAAPSAHGAQFHVWTAPAVAAGTVATVDIWVARADQAAQVTELAGTDTLPAPDAEVLDPGQTPLTLQLFVDGVLVGPVGQRGFWTGAVQRVRLQAPVPRQARSGAHAARVRLRVGGLSIGELSFVLQVRPDAMAGAPAEDAQAVRRMVPSAFACFVGADLPAVQACIDDVHRVAPDLDVFIGAPQLRSSEGWRPRIEQMLSRCDRLYLFWSQGAAESPWVDFEWREVLRRRGPASIDVVLLDPPRVAPLPPELADMPVTLRAAPDPAGIT